MDDTEARAKKCLEYLGFIDPEFEPEGNIPPDFLCNKNVAVEVRRLNKHTFNGVKAEGLEQAAIPIWRNLQKLLESYGPPRFSQSFYVFHRFSRPLPEWKLLEKNLNEVLQPYLSGTYEGKIEKKLCVILRFKFFHHPLKSRLCFISRAKVTVRREGGC